MSQKIFIGYHTLMELNNHLLHEFSAFSKFILVDENTYCHCFPLLEKVIQLNVAKKILIKSGERNKNIKIVEQIWEELSFAEADRKSLLINLGGGVLMDIGGFAASTYKRGINFINIPTTLIAQVDASIGGKTGVNIVLRNNSILKNHIGVFNNPDSVFIYPEFIQTISKRERLSGFAEIIKHALVYDKIYWNLIKRVNNIDDLSGELLEKIIFRSVQIKRDIVSTDPYENGLRKCLNFGHTIGHALESYSLENDKNPLLHGEAIAIGLFCECYLSTKILSLPTNEFSEAIIFIKKFFPYYKMDSKIFPKLISLMRNDKKNEQDQINFSLLTEIGKCKVNNTCIEEVIVESLEYYRNEYLALKI